MESGQYDPEIIAQLRLEKLNITRLSGLERCVNLFDLSLAYNDISDIMGLNDLCFLQRLNLSYNKIRKIDNLDKLVKLEWLDLRGNSIATASDVVGISLCSSLKSVYLQDPNGTSANPICSNPKYSSMMVQYLPSLEILDGSHTALLQSAKAILFFEEELKMDESKESEPMKVGEWINQTDLDVDTHSLPEKALNPNDSYNKAFQQLAKSEDLLRNASNSLSKSSNK